MRAFPAAAAALLLMLAGCAAQRPTPPAREAHRPAPPSRETPREAAQPVSSTASWSFSTTAESCVATAAGSSRSATLTVRVDRSVQLSVSARGASRLAFSGPGGSWTLHVSGRRGADVTLPLGGTAVSRVLALLAGGRLRIEGAHAAVLLLPDAGISGRDWIGCARGKVDAAARQS
jgi:hypothetical protein